MNKNFPLRDLLVIGILLFAGITLVVAQNNLRISPTRGDPAVISSINVNVDSFGVARFNATGFRPFEGVELYISSTSKMLPFDVVLAQWTAFADENGVLSVVWSGGIAEPSLMIRAVGLVSNLSLEKRFSTLARPTVAAANLDQCRNGPIDLANDCSGDQWEHGNLNGSQAHYIEGDSVPYRLTFDGLDTAVPHTVTIQWDTTEGGKHAIDYLTTFNRTEALANPCFGVTGCTITGYTALAIPPDPNVIAGMAPVVPEAGEFRLFGGTLLNASAYTLIHDYSTTSHTSITLTFTADVPNPVLAWGGHISKRADWGIGNSAISINGSPFHMRLLDLDGQGGNQDRGLASDAVYFPGDITIIKDSQPDSVILFPFTATGPDVFNFSLKDDGVGADTDYLHSFVNLIRFGPAHSVTITEDPNNTMEVSAINCVSDPRGGSGTNNNIIAVPNQSVEIFLEEGESVTCTFVNTLSPTSALASVDGRVYDKYGRGIPRAQIELIPSSGGAERFRAMTSSFGYYRIEDIPTGRAYVMLVTAKGYQLTPPSMVIDLNDNISGLDFIASEDP